MPVYSLEERQRARHAVTRLNASPTKPSAPRSAACCCRRSPKAGIVQLTGTSERSNQIDALTALGADLQKRHLDKLLPLARDEFNAFCEYVNPDEAADLGVARVPHRDACSGSSSTPSLTGSSSTARRATPSRCTSTPWC
jgi:hypothetical protein